MANRHFIEKLEQYTDKSGHKYEVRADLVEGKRPAISISTGGDVVQIDAEDWDVIADCVRRGIETVGDHPDDVTT